MKNTKVLKKSLLYYCCAILILFLVHLTFMSSNVTDGFESLTTTYNINANLSEVEVLEKLKAGQIENIVQKDDTYILKATDNEYYSCPVTDSIYLGIQIENIPIVQEKVEKSGNTGIGLFKGVLIAIMLSIVLSFLLSLFRQSQIINASKEYMTTLDEDTLQSMGIPISATKKNEISPLDKNTMKVTFDDVQGIEELKPDLYRLVDCLKNPEKYKNIGARMPKGVILYGPPGTGKTLTAKAIAGEADVPFFSMCGSDFMEKYVGVGASRIRELYKKARKEAPCIVFIDEIDAIGGGRGEENSGEKDQTINALLAELDGFKSVDGVLTICATNRLDILDPALLRAGRFDLKLAVGLPDKEGRLAILKLHGKNKKFSEDVDMDALSKQTIGFSGAELENLLNESALIAANNDKEVISNEDLENAFFKIIMEGNKKPRKEQDEEMFLTAWHEAGHTLVTKLLTKDSVPTVTIIQSTSGAGGVTFMAPDEKGMPSKKYLRNKIKIDYAGRAAEEIYLGSADDVTTGASQDIKSATAVIKAYIGAYGMGDKGLLDIKQLTSQYDIVEEATQLSKSLYTDTLDLLKSNFKTLKALAERLIEKETLYEDEIDEIIKANKEENILKVDA